MCGTLANLDGHVETVPCASPAQMRFWRSYLTTMRPYLLPVSAMAGVAGMSVGAVQGALRWALGMLVFTFSYGFGQALTDCFQKDTDSLSSPYRPLVQGLVSARDVLVVSMGGLAAGMIILAALNPWCLPAAGLATVGLLVYTPFKRIWWAGPIANAWIVALLPVMGWLAAGSGTLKDVAREPAVLSLAILSLCSYANFVLVGYLKDIDADRRTDYNTFPVKFGWTRTAVVSHVWALASAGACAWTLGQLSSGATAVAWVIFALACLVSVYAQVSLHRIRTPDQAHGAIANVVRAFLLLHSAVMAGAGPAVMTVAVVIYLAFEVLLAVRPERRQI